jgi:outer membrane receptor protein involved in Fe transport
VVNIITKKNFAGLEVSAYTGGTSNGGFLYTLGATGGERSDKGGFLLSFQWYDQSDVLAGQRDLSKQDMAVNHRTGETVTEGSSGVPEGRFGHAGASDSNMGNATYRELRRRSNDAGNFFRDPEDGWRANMATGNSDIGAGDNYNYQPENYLLTPSQRISLWGQGDYELGSRARAYFEASYTNRKSEQLLAPEPLFTATEQVVVSRDNVYNPFGRDLFDVRRRLVEFGNRFFYQDVNTARAVLGLDGSFTDEGFFNTWTYDMNFGYGRTQGTDSKMGNLIRHKLQAAVGPSFFDETGTAVCGTPDNVPTEPCVPLNLFGGVGSITPEQVRGLTYEGVARGLSDQLTYNVQTNGELFELWKRPVGIALGYSYRREKGEYVPDPLTNSGDTTGNKTEKTGGGYRENAGFVELNVPLVADVPAVQLFEVQAALRFFNFDTFGSDATYKFGGRWQLFEHIALRATYSTAFRAPSVAELYQGQADNFPDASDPCSVFNQDTGENDRTLTPAQQANCAAEGIPTDHSDDRVQLRSRVGGNPALQAETAKILTFGTVITPKGSKFIDGLSLTVDYFAVDVDNAITSKTAEVILANCYNKTPRSEEDCNLITRNAFNAIEEISDLNTNIGGFETTGIDFGIVYSLPTDVGTVRATFDGIILGKFNQILADGTVVEGKGAYDPIQGVYPGLRFNVGASWGWEGILAGVAGRYTGSIVECEGQDCSDQVRSEFAAGVADGTITDDPETPENETIFPERTVHTNFVADIYAGYSFSTTLGYTSLQAGINNVFNSPPPKIFNGFLANSDANTYDYLGRWFYIGLRHAL